MFNCKAKKTAAIFPAALFMLIACLTLCISACMDNYDIPIPIWLDSLTVTGNDGAVGNNAHILLQAGNERTYTAAVSGETGGEAVVWKWDVTQSAEVVKINGSSVTNSVNIEIMGTGEAFIKVKASVKSNFLEAGFFINVQPAGVGSWAFSISKSSESVPDGSKIEVSPDEETSFSLAAAGIAGEPNPADVTYTIASGSDDFIIAPASVSGNGSFAINVKAGTKQGMEAEITVNAKRASETGSLQKKFTVVSGKSKLPQAGVLFEWDYLDNTITKLDGVVPNSAYPDVTFRGRAFSTEISPDLNYGRIYWAPSVNNGRLIIGGPADVSGLNTNPSTHYPGAFNLYDGTFKLTVHYSDAAKGSNYLLRIFINNNNTSKAESVLGGLSALRDYETVAELQAGVPASWSTNEGIKLTGGKDEAGPGWFAITFNAYERYKHVNATGVTDINSLKTAFIALHCHGESGSSIKLTGIKLERVEEE